MKRCIKLIFFLIIFIFQVQFHFANLVHASEGTNNIILLVDNSYSMKTTDPNKLSVVAATMLIDSIEGDNNINIIAFGDRTSSPYTLQDKPIKENLKSMLAQLKFDNNYTDLKEGLKVALNQMEAVQGKKNIIILSDGKEDPLGGLTENHKAEINALVKKAYEMKVKLNTIGLSQAADKQNLSNISLKTNGKYFYCDNPAEVFNVFDKIFGNLNGLDNLESYNTQAVKVKEFKFSPYIKEIVIKVASCNNRMPFIEVTQNNNEIPPEESGDVYRIFKIKNNGNSIVKVSSKDEGNNLVITQVNDNGNLNIKADVDNLTIPCNVPLGILAQLNIKDKVRGLYLEKLEGGNREIVNKTDNSFQFAFKKDKVGVYPLLLMAKDGEGNIISIKNALINVTGDVGFYYTNELPKKIMTKRSFIVELKQVDSQKIENISGEVIVDYKNSTETFPLKYENGVLYTEIKLKKSGKATLTTSINGISNNESFSYYVSKENINVKIAPSFGYFLYKIKVFIIIILVFILILSSSYIIGSYYFKEYVQTFTISKEINYKMGNSFRNNILNIVLSSKNTIAYINSDQKQLFISDKESNPIGYFELIRPKQYKCVQGLLYIIKKDKLFSVQYHELANQNITQFGETLSTPIKYEDNIKINLNRRNSNIQILFT